MNSQHSAVQRRRLLQLRGLSAVGAGRALRTSCRNAGRRQQKVAVPSG